MMSRIAQRENSESLQQQYLRNRFISPKIRSPHLVAENLHSLHSSMDFVAHTIHWSAISMWVYGFCEDETGQVCINMQDP